MGGFWRFAEIRAQEKKTQAAAMHMRAACGPDALAPAVLLCPSLGQLRASQLSTWAWKGRCDHGDTKLSSESSKEKCFVMFLRRYLRGSYRALPTQWAQIGAGWPIEVAHSWHRREAGECPVLSLLTSPHRELIFDLRQEQTSIMLK